MVFLGIAHSLSCRRPSLDLPDGRAKDIRSEISYPPALVSQINPRIYPRYIWDAFWDIFRIYPGFIWDIDESGIYVGYIPDKSRIYPRFIQHPRFI
jgi:hypothetical protein